MERGRRILRGEKAFAFVVGSLDSTCWIRFSVAGLWLALRIHLDTLHLQFSCLPPCCVQTCGAIASQDPRHLVLLAIPPCPGDPPSPLAAPTTIPGLLPEHPRPPCCCHQMTHRLLSPEQSVRPMVKGRNSPVLSGRPRP